MKSPLNDANVVIHGSRIPNTGVLVSECPIHIADIYRPI